MTHAEYKVAYAKLSPAQHEWLKAKADWEHMTLWAVMNDWTPPADSELNPDGTTV